ncbi:hypothetical protein AAFF_G00030580 [Aldrovandia affinis]|uniref:Ig-like domain-containing protein n=1 Tax=Aldrovandia affinis TaxID=143900 RepID=A0AAD7WFZ7_9TELE|nr:hypothetical protein AAFF_G00030580 [Aldrovandia affinis]
MRGRAGGTGPRTMARLVCIWIVCVWTAEAAQELCTLYTDQKPSESLHCSKDIQKPCSIVSWCRKLHGQDEFQFLLSHTIGGKTTYSSQFNQTKFKGGLRDNNSKFTLTILSLEKGDTGLYFCVLQCNGAYHLGSYVTDLRAGDRPPTLPPPSTTQKTKRIAPCPCPDKGKSRAKQGCSHLVVWPLVAVLLSLAIVVIATLFYFSRLPKKCRHHFLKK